MWLPGYEQIPITSCAGNLKPNTAWKIVLHTTESPFGSLPGVIDLFRNNPCSCPHFSIDPGTGRKVQFIPLDNSAAALRSGRNGFETNRAHAVQVEICGYAQEAGSWNDSVLKFIGGWIADVTRAVPINLAHVTDNAYQGTVAIESSPYRMSGPGFEAFDGVCGHIDAPFNDHYDPYHLDKRRCVQHALDILGTHAPTEGDLSMADAASLEAQIAALSAQINRNDQDTRAYEGQTPLKLPDSEKQYLVVWGGQGWVKRWLRDQSEVQALVAQNVLQRAAGSATSTGLQPFVELAGPAADWLRGLPEV